ncbi:unnamed protein product [Linum tenue]|uniref:Pectinesterase n=1 Tax=Linum tenue TaxID=586396 RepID=A0AAV0J3G1_9ROSI|nr:unnamed protein product [Linum tenue]
MSITTLLISLLLCIILSLLTPTASSSSSDEQLSSWCKETPNPDTCARFVTRTAHPNSRPNQRAAFREMNIEAALRKALDVQSQLISLKSKCRTPRETTVWGDCTKLHASTVRHLNSTLSCLRGPARCTDFDAQTWLSSALTNVETCRAGSTDLKIPGFVAPVVESSNHLSELITNTLAVNGALLTAEEKENASADDEFVPNRWMKRGERKLLEGSIASVDIRADAVVAKDGSGGFATVQAAIDFAAKRNESGERFVIRVKRGVYVENIEILDGNHNVWLVGDGMADTVITGDRNVGSGSYTTFSSATAGIDGARFVARGITFANTAGPEKGQAVALRSASDLAVFYQCSFQGYQDTVFVQTQRQFFRECHVSGTVDFIFGNAAAVFQKCLIFVRKPILGQTNIITAQGRLNAFEHTGISIHNSKILPSPELKMAAPGQFETYLGRPWMKYSRSVIMKSYLDRIVNPAGWSKWGGTDFGLNTLYFGEYKNFGPGSSLTSRVNWKGFHAIPDVVTAKHFTVNGLYAGRSWLPSTGVPFNDGL